MATTETLFDSAIFDSSTPSTTKTLGVAVRPSDMKHLVKYKIKDFHWVESINKDSITHLFDSMESEWDLIVLNRISDLKIDQIKLLLEAIRLNPEKSLCFLNAGELIPDPLIIDWNNVDDMSDVFRNEERNTLKPDLAIFANTEQDKENAIAHLNEGGYKLSFFENVKIFGALSEENPQSTIDDAIDFVSERAHRVLAMSDLSEFNRNPVEVQKILKRIDDAESMVCIRFFNRSIVEWRWILEKAGRTPFSFFKGNDLSRLIRGLEPVASYYFHHPYGGDSSGSTKLEGREYKLIQTYMNKGITQEEIANKLGVSRATIGRHVAKMRKAGLLRN